MESKVISQEIDFKPREFLHPTYKLSKLTPIEGSQSQTVTPTAVTENNFKIPNRRAWNPSESWVTFTWTPGASPANNYHWTPENTIAPIGALQLTAQGNGTQLANYQNFNTFICCETNL